MLNGRQAERQPFGSWTCSSFERFDRDTGEVVRVSVPLASAGAVASIVKCLCLCLCLCLCEAPAFRQIPQARGSGGLTFLLCKLLASE